eukprot:TRINITY_DN50912_c0_g1_i2.p1 TRINITY_DN50912_c0_g1~~TRINITY_DN50912_c0_g1_i2.p1  ORF type:complete len:307 (-),score=64.24 TRINITY_DN50912_c0_g1_i2:460-1380(-)
MDFRHVQDPGSVWCEAEAGQLLEKAYAQALPDAAAAQRLWFGGRFDSLEALQQSLQDDPASLYGEITQEGVERLLQRCNLKAGDCFADLGSGLGRCTLQAHLCTEAAECLGIELDKDRHLAASAAASRLVSNLRSAASQLEQQADAPSQALSRMPRRLTLLQGDLLLLWRAWRHADVVFCSSLCFPDKVMSTLADQLDACQRLRLVASLKMLPRYETFTLVAVERWPMTWQKQRGCPVYVYERLPYYPVLRALLEEPWYSHRQPVVAAAAAAASQRFWAEARQARVAFLLLCAILPWSASPGALIG